MKTIYFDNAATTQVDEQVTRAMLPYFSDNYGNASSLHQKGLEAREAVEKARQIIAKSVNAKPEDIIFTSGGTESNNLAIKGLAFAYPEKKHIITSKIEHDCILNSCKWLEKKGYRITYLDVDHEGFIDLKQLEKSITNNTLLVSIIHGNNEIGTIQNIEAIGKICGNKKVYFHSDACQSYMKTEIDVEKQNIDLLTLNAHKLHGPKGVGALYLRKGIKLESLLSGGGQERNIRSGTENVPGIVGFAKAVELFDKKDVEKMKKLRDRLVLGLEKLGKINGPRERRLCSNVNVRFDGIEGESILLMLDKEGIEVSTGSACSSKSLEPSHVLIAIGVKPEQAHGSIRISLGKFNTPEEANKLLEVLPKIVSKLNKISPFGG